MRSNEGKDYLYSNGHSKSSYDVNVYLKNNKCCGSININQLKIYILKFKLQFLPLNLLAQSIFVKLDDF